MKFFTIETDSDGVATITFDRPPVNAVSKEVLPEIGELADALTSDDTIRSAVLTCPPDARAWCGGADLHDFLELDYESRLARYKILNANVPKLYAVDRPIVAAITMPTIGVGLVLASFCDIRVASKDAFFAAPEIDRGVLAGGGAFFNRLNMPQGFIRELIFTGRRFPAEDMYRNGYLNYILPKEEVLPKSLEIARLMAKKSLPALKLQKVTTNDAETMETQEAYVRTNQLSAQLTAGTDSKEGIRAFLESREPQYTDNH